MAMTIEQKVVKKAKGIDKLNYKKGVAIVSLSIDETASEYSSDITYTVRLYFKSKAAISRVAKILGDFRFKKKDMIARFERGYNSIDLQLTGYERFSIEGGQNISKEIKYRYENHYSGRRFFVTLDPRKPLTDEEKEYRTGSVADGEYLSDYFTNLQQAIIEGNTAYIL